MRPHRPKVLRLLPRQIHHRVRSNQQPDDGRVRPRRAISRIIVRPSRFASREELSLSVAVCKNHIFSDSFRAILKMIARHPSTRRRRHHRPRSRRRRRKHPILAERSRRRPRLCDVDKQRRRRRSGLETVSKMMRFSIKVCERRRRRRRRRSPRRGTRRRAQRSSHLSLFLRSLSTCAYGFACVIRQK